MKLRQLALILVGASTAGSLLFFSCGKDDSGAEEQTSEEAAVTRPLAITGSTSGSGIGAAGMVCDVSPACIDADANTCYVGYTAEACAGIVGSVFDPNNGCPTAHRLGCCEGADGGTANFAYYEPFPAATAKTYCDTQFGGRWRAARAP